MEDMTLEELRERLGEEGLVLLDVRSPLEFSGEAATHRDPRQGHIAGARNLPLDELLACRCAEDVRVLVGPEGTEVVAYCHSGSRSAFAAQVLRARLPRAELRRPWHEWSRDLALPGGQ